MSGAICGSCGERAGKLNMASSDFNARVDRRWSGEGGGRGHRMHQLGKRFPSRAALRREIRKQGLVCFDGPMGTEVGVPATTYTDQERKMRNEREIEKITIDFVRKI